MDNRSVSRHVRFSAALCYVSVLILIPACTQFRKDDFVKFHLNQGLVVLSLVGLVQALRGYMVPLPLVSYITRNFHPFG